MFELFKFFSSALFESGVLGNFEKINGLWEGSISLMGNKKTPILIFGNRSGPDFYALESMVEVLNSWDEISNEIQNSLFEHYLRGPTWNDSYPRIDRARLMASVVFEQILVEMRRGRLVIEISIRTAWDEEHTLGARLVNLKLEELCESI